MGTRRAHADAVVFDLDGLLLESEQEWSAAKRELTDKRGGTWNDAAELRRQREALRAQIVQLDAANADNWNEVRDQLNTLLTDLQRMLERARTRDKAGP